MIKNRNVFFVSDATGAVNQEKVEGLFFRDTRYISKYQIYWNDIKVSGTMKKEGNIEKVCYQIDNSFEIIVNRWIYQDSMYEKICFKNNSKESIEGTFKIYHEEDFKDIFTVRNYRFGESGEVIQRDFKVNEFKMIYLGKDNIKRYINFIGEGCVNDQHTIEYKINLKIGEEKIINQVWSLSQGNDRADIASMEDSFSQIKHEKVDIGKTYSEDVRDLLMQSLKDIELLTNEIEGKMYISAGVPNFSTLFGRDSIIIGIQLLKRNPKILKETLELLAKRQGEKEDPYLEEEPDKILHEFREGELANTKQAPFYPYYGSIDSTLLFLIGIAEYFKETGDKQFLLNILDSARRALNWIDEYGDRDKDGFVEYIQLSDKGFNNHGWKDSDDSVVHLDGTLANGAIALSEVQGYAYKAKLEWSEIFKQLKEAELSEKLFKEASALKDKFNKEFWMGDYFALALDGEKNKVEVVTSNPLHCLYCGIIDDDKIPLVVKRAFKKDMFSPYGIRTMGSAEKPYDPLSYHNGSIWPHDNSIIALGLKKYGYVRELELLAQSIFDAGNKMNNYQMPELFGGEDLNLYEEACVPQGWAAGSVILLNDLLV